MGYVAVKGGTKAIEASIRHLRQRRLEKETPLSVEAIDAGLRGLIDQLMSEASLYDPFLASLAIKQAQGSPEEAVFLLRAYRSTLERIFYSRTFDAASMRVERRISASFKDIPGGQILGASYDYTHRLLDFSLLTEGENERRAVLEEAAAQAESEPKALPKVVDILRREALSESFTPDDSEPKDVTKDPLRFPSVRSERLQILTRGQTGAVTALGYAALRGYGMLHPTIGELRVGFVPVSIADPQGAEAEEDYYLGEIEVTEVESFIPESVVHPDGSEGMHFQVGYGLCYGQNETKAIAMSLLDAGLENPDESNPVRSEEFVLLHVDSVEASGFMSHLKLPHYVTFQSKLDSLRKAGQ